MRLGCTGKKDEEVREEALPSCCNHDSPFEWMKVSICLSFLNFLNGSQQEETKKNASLRSLKGGRRDLSDSQPVVAALKGQEKERKKELLPHPLHHPPIPSKLSQCALSQKLVASSCKDFRALSLARLTLRSLGFLNCE